MALLFIQRATMKCIFLVILESENSLIVNIGQLIEDNLVIIYRKGAHVIRCIII